MIVRLTIAFTLVAFAVCCTAHDVSEAVAAKPPIVELTILSGRSDSLRPTLDIQLQYLGQNEVTISESNLPWRMQRSLLLVAVCLDAKRQIVAESLSLENPSVNSMTLKPGQTMSGSVDLLDRFPKLNECIKEREALVFWSYQLLPRNSEPSLRVNGGTVIPPTSLKH